MRTIKLLTLVLSLIFEMPMFLTADEEEVEFQLVEVVGLQLGDNPLDGSGEIGTPTSRPTDFLTTITGRTLAVTSDNANATQVIVRNASGNVVLNRQFVGFTAEQLSAYGAHSIEINNGGLTLVGNFQAQ